MTLEMDQETRQWAMACHLVSLIGFAGVPFGNIIGPLVIWLVKREESPFIDAHGKESLNFQLTMTLYAFASIILFICGIGILTLIGVIIAGLVYAIKASIAANQGRTYSYPDFLRLRFID